MSRFHALAERTHDVVGTPWALASGILLVLAWAASGPVFGWSDRWFFSLTHVTAIVTFLLVFVVESRQRHLQKAVNLKLDELLRAVEHARTGLVRLELLPEEELDRLAKEFEALRRARGRPPPSR